MKSGSIASFNSAAPIELYPGEPDYDECEHGYPNFENCPNCEYDRLLQDYIWLEEECSYAEDRADRLTIIVDALASELKE